MVKIELYRQISLLICNMDNIMVFKKMSPAAIVEELGYRLKQARLNADLTQAEVAAGAGLDRRTVLNAEKGKVQLENLVAILVFLGMADQLNLFLPVQEISPLQLAKLKGRKRQRASRSKNRKARIKKDKPAW